MGGVCLGLGVLCLPALCHVFLWESQMAEAATFRVFRRFTLLLRVETFVIGNRSRFLKRALQHVHRTSRRAFRNGSGNAMLK